MMLDDEWPVVCSLLFNTEYPTCYLETFLKQLVKFTEQC